MDLFSIFLLVVLGISFLSGVQKGFLTSLLATFAFLIAWIAAGAFVSNFSSRFLNSEFHADLQAHLTPFADTLSLLGEDGNLLCADASPRLQQISETLLGVNFPQSILDSFSASLSVYASYTVSACLTELLWRGLVRGISFVLLFVFFYIAAMLPVNLFTNVFCMPKLKGLDGILGGLFSLLRCYVCICLLVSLLPMLYTLLDSFLVKAILDHSSLVSYFMNSEYLLSDLFGVSAHMASIMRG